MSALDELLEDHSRDAVPQEKTVSGLRIGMILTGITITVPAFLVGIELGQGMGFLQSSGAAFTGGLVLFLVGALSGTIAAKTHLSTYMILQYTFGRQGGRIVSFIIALTSLGWFAVTLGLFADALASTLANYLGLVFEPNTYLLPGSILMIGTTIFGFKALDKISLAIVPLLALFLVFVALYSLRLSGFDSVLAFQSSTISFGQGVSAVIGGYIVGMTLLPDLCRYAKSTLAGIKGAFIGSFIGYPLVLVLSALPSIATLTHDYVAILAGLGLGGLGVIMLILATWTTNANNLYSGSLAISSIITSLAKWKITIIIGLAGSLLAVSGLTQNLIGFLLILGYLVPPVAGVYITDYFLISDNYRDRNLETQRNYKTEAFLSWIIASSVGYATTSGYFFFTSIPSLDTIIVASVSFYFLSRVLSFRHQAKSS